ncbi:hypothetical protein ACFWP3_36275 [Streptomyces sp. NPDC058525]|uniref:hypothetical protein n=1 Tax=Streptomyces sp. NPDC058525 TaxID=3346538 RepID=UPI0036691616
MQDPSAVEVSRPSDALAAKEATDDTLSGLLQFLCESLLLYALGGASHVIGGPAGFYPSPPATTTAALSAS